MTKRIVLSGYYGFGNTGDEAVLAGILSTFRKTGLDAQVTVLSADPARTLSEHPGVRAAHRYRPVDMIGAIRSADLVISGGGSLLQDVTSARSVHYYLFVLQLARLFRRKAMVYAQGIGPLNGESTRRSVSKVLNRTDLITVRDSESKATLEEIGVRKPPLHLTADPALTLEPNLCEADRIIAAAGLEGAELLGVSLRPWLRAQDGLDEAARGIASACRTLGVTPALIPMQESEDIGACEAVEGGVLLRGSGRSDVVKGLTARCGLVVGMRLHALILAAAEGVPIVPLSYDPKVSSFASAAGARHTLQITSATAREVEDAVLSAWRNREAEAAEVRSNCGVLRELALESGRLAASLLA